MTLDCGIVIGIVCLFQILDIFQFKTLRDILDELNDKR